MKAKAAICRAWGQPITIEEIDVAPSKDNEVMVKVAYGGLCRSDLSTWKNTCDMEILPFVQGHECAGIVEETGPGVTHLKQGDHVVAGLAAWCGRCTPCMNGMIHICDDYVASMAAGKLIDGTTRFTDSNGDSLNINITSAFSEYTVLPERQCVKIPDELPLEQACLLSCCVPTGWGSAVRIAKITPGQSVAIWGMGGVGLSIVQGARFRSANPIIAVDLEGSKKNLALEMGATHFINSSDQDPVPAIQELTKGRGVDCAFEAIGDPGAYLQASYTLGVAGKLVGVGIIPVTDTVSIPALPLVLQQQQFLGSSYGGTRPQIDIPVLADLAIKGELKLEQMITRQFILEEINEALEAMEKRKIVGRWICDHNSF